MTRKDYTLLTDVFAKEYRQATGNLERWINTREVDLAKMADCRRIYTLQCAEMLADKLAEDNKAFDKDKFINDIRGQ